MDQHSERSALSELEDELKQKKGVNSFNLVIVFVLVVMSGTVFTYFKSESNGGREFMDQIKDPVPAAIIFLKLLLPLVGISLFINHKKMGWILTTFFCIFWAMTMLLSFGKEYILFHSYYPLTKFLFDIQTALMMLLVFSSSLLLSRNLLERFSIPKALFAWVFGSSTASGLVYWWMIPKFIGNILPAYS